MYRDGCSEGQYENIIKYEVPLLKHALRELGCNAKVTLMVVNKLQVREKKFSIHNFDFLGHHFLQKEHRSACEGSGAEHQAGHRCGHWGGASKANGVLLELARGAPGFYIKMNTFFNH